MYIYLYLYKDTQQKNLTLAFGDALETSNVGVQRWLRPLSVRVVPVQVQSWLEWRCLFPFTFSINKRFLFIWLQAFGMPMPMYRTRRPLFDRFREKLTSILTTSWKTFGSFYVVHSITDFPCWSLISNTVLWLGPGQNLFVTASVDR